MALSAWLSEELVREAAFQGGAPGEVLPPPQSDNTAKDTGPGSQGRACTEPAGSWDTDHQCMYGVGGLGCPFLQQGLTETLSWEEPGLGLFPYQKLRIVWGSGVEAPTHSGHTVTPQSFGFLDIFSFTP